MGAAQPRTDGVVLGLKHGGRHLPLAKPTRKLERRSGRKKAGQESEKWRTPGLLRGALCVTHWQGWGWGHILPYGAQHLHLKHIQATSLELRAVGGVCMVHILRLAWGLRGLPDFPSAPLISYLSCLILCLHLTSVCCRVSRICHFADSSFLLLIAEGMIAGRRGQTSGTNSYS